MVKLLTFLLAFWVFQTFGRGLENVLIVYCHSRVSKIRCLNELLGGTHRISCNRSAGCFIECKILNPWYWFLGELAWQHIGTGFLHTRWSLQQMLLISKCPKPFAGLQNTCLEILKEGKMEDLWHKLNYEFNLIEKWRTNCGEEECASHRILHDAVCVTIFFWGGGFSTSDESFLPHTRVYVQIVHWEKIWIYSKSVGSHTYVQIPLEVSCESRRSSTCWCTGFST